jgi:hypothetical protein
MIDGEHYYDIEEYEPKLNWKMVNTMFKFVIIVFIFPCMLL